MYAYRIKQVFPSSSHVIDVTGNVFEQPGETCCGCICHFATRPKHASSHSFVCSLVFIAHVCLCSHDAGGLICE